ncbi:MAG TPA: S9 family peptidase [Terriglobales bacterium]|nr:S9 family peptidase [Terriglobales bacterium]
MPMPPLAARRPHRESRHGEAIEDDYAWLRERENPGVRAYLEAENAYTAQATAAIEPLAETLYKEMLGRIQQTDLSVPVRRGGFWYFSRTEEGKQYPIHCRKADREHASEEVILDLNQLAVGQSYLAVGAIAISDDAHLLAYTTDTTGMRRYRLHIKDLRNGALRAETAERVTTLEWASDNQTLLFTTEDEVTKRSDRLWRLHLGAEAAEIYYEPDELYHMGVQRTRDRQFLMLGIGATDSTEFRYWRADAPEAEPRLFLARERDHKYDLDHRQGLFYIRTNRGAKNFRVAACPVGATDMSQWREFLPHDPAVLIDGLELFQDWAVALEKFEALDRLRVFEFAAGTWRTIAVPEPVYALGPSANPEFEASEFRYQYQSPVTPPSVFAYDWRTGASTLLKQQPVLGGYDSSQYQCVRLWATAPDGVRVPLSAVHRRGFLRDGTGAVLLYGYGAYGYGMEASFSSARLSLLDRGLAYVVAHVRGGNEMGEAWHDDGMLMKKKNTFTDFIAAAEHLIAAGWTSPARLAIQGGSAGGLLIGAVVNLRPELFRAAHLAVPFVDVMNTMCDASLPLTVGEYLEWGDPRRPTAYAYMRSYSPYDNLEAKAYPALLVTTSLNDSQVMYWEPAKYVARLRRLNTGPTPPLLKTNLGAGHGGASGRYDRLRETSFEFAWLLAAVGAAGVASTSS